MVFFDRFLLNSLPILFARRYPMQKINSMCFAVIMLLCIVGCTSTGPLSPGIDNSQGQVASSSSVQDRVAALEAPSELYSKLLGEGTSDYSVSPILYKAFDVGSGEMDVVPLRTLDVHVNVTKFVQVPFCSDCIHSNYSWNPGGWWDIIVGAKNKTKLTGYDVRLLIFDEFYPGPGEQYPISDDLTPSMPNGYNYYHWFASFKTPNREFPGYSFGWETVFTLDSQTPDYVFAIDASWPGHCQEPFQIVNFWQSNPLLGNGYGACTITTDINDWQGNVGTVFCDLSFMGGSSTAVMSWLGGATWGLNLGSFWLSPGWYPIIITAYSPDAAPPANNIRDLAFVYVI